MEERLNKVLTEFAQSVGEDIAQLRGTVDGVVLIPGPQGIPGAKGDKGDTGETGSPGADSIIPGPKGDKGDTGATGPAGAASTIPGPTGPQGVPGNTGLTGAKGETGATGPKGDKGDTGATGAGLTTFSTTTALKASTGQFFGALAVAQDTGATYRWMTTPSNTTATWVLWDWAAIPFSTYGVLLGATENGRALEASVASGIFTLNYNVSIAAGIPGGTSVVQMLAGFRPAATIPDTAQALAPTSGIAFIEVATNGYLYAWGYSGVSGTVTSLRGTVSYRLAA